MKDGWPKFNLHNPTFFRTLQILNEIKTICGNGNFQYAYGTKVNAESEDVFIKDLDQNLLKILKKKGKEVINILLKRFLIYHLSFRIDWELCVLGNDNVCRDYFLK